MRTTRHEAAAYASPATAARPRSTSLEAWRVRSRCDPERGYADPVTQGEGDASSVGARQTAGEGVPLMYGIPHLHDLDDVAVSELRPGAMPGC